MTNICPILYNNPNTPTLRIEEEIKQAKFKNEHLKAHINVLFSAAWMNQITNQILKPENLSWQQFNILRILKGQYPSPSTVKKLTERMIDKMSNASRLVDKLDKKGLIERIPYEKDRRRINIYITEKGLEKVNELSGQLEVKMLNSMDGISLEEAKLLNKILDKMRS